jgi:hypothetical protein
VLLYNLFDLCTQLAVFLLLGMDVFQKQLMDGGVILEGCASPRSTSGCIAGDVIGFEAAKKAMAASKFLIILVALGDLVILLAKLWAFWVAFEILLIA